MNILSLSSLVLSALLVNGANVDPRSADQALNSPPPEACADPRLAVPLYRASNPNLLDHFFTANLNEMNNFVNTQGYIYEGVTGWIFNSSQPSTVPLYRLWSGALTDHYYTTSASNRSDAILFRGYVDEGITGYMYDVTTSCGGVAWWQLWSASTTDSQYTASVAERDFAISAGATLLGIAGYVLPY